MIGQSLSNTNESATIPILQNFFGTKQNKTRVLLHGSKTIEQPLAFSLKQTK